MLRQETDPSWFVVSDVTVDQDLPPLLVPASETEVPAPAAQQWLGVVQDTELSQPVLSRVCMPPQVAPPSRDSSATGPAADSAEPAPVQAGGPSSAGRHDTLKNCWTLASDESAERLQ